MNSLSHVSPCRSDKSTIKRSRAPSSYSPAGITMVENHQCEIFPTFRSTHPSPKVCPLPINNWESMTSRLPNKAVQCHSPTQANSFYFYIFGENHVSAINNTHREKRKAPALRSPLPLHLLLRQTSDERPAAPSAHHLLAFG